MNHISDNAVQKNAAPKTPPKHADQKTPLKHADQTRRPKKRRPKVGPRVGLKLCMFVAVAMQLARQCRHDVSHTELPYPELLFVDVRGGSPSCHNLFATYLHPICNIFCCLWTTTKCGRTGGQETMANRTRATTGGGKAGDVGATRETAARRNPPHHPPTPGLVDRAHGSDSCVFGVVCIPRRTISVDVRSSLIFRSRQSRRTRGW